MTDAFALRAGSLPMLVSFPHDGQLIPPEIQTSMTAAGKSSRDTDWWVREQYRFLDELGTSVIVAQYSRYVIDLNRAPDDSALYPGRSETSLCPTESFDGEPLYLDETPRPAEIQRRIKTYWQPYHDALKRELSRLLELHGYVVLWDAHSIRGYVPRFFSGRLPDFNFGTNGDRSADPAFGSALLDYCRSHVAEQAVLNARFKGGYITRHYGNPPCGVHAIQLELNQQLYLQDETNIPPALDPQKTLHLQAILRQLVEHTVHTATCVAGSG